MAYHKENSQIQLLLQIADEEEKKVLEAEKIINEREKTAKKAEILRNRTISCLLSDEGILKTSYDKNPSEKMVQAFMDLFSLVDDLREDYVELPHTPADIVSRVAFGGPAGHKKSNEIMDKAESALKGETQFSGPSLTQQRLITMIASYNELCRENLITVQSVRARERKRHEKQTLAQGTLPSATSRRTIQITPHSTQ